MTRHDLIIRNGTIVDGSSGPSFVGDVAIDDGWITEVGAVERKGAREIDATGLTVTPGFVDIHTHYDGQLIWSKRMSPSSDHGVTTVMTGNCGIGFAPCRAGDRDALIKLMEGVEDIPEAVTSVGLTWDWETFPEFLDAIDRRERDVDVIVLLPHSPLRVFAMGERAINREAATTADIARMQEIAREALDAGAFGIGTSQMHAHRSSTGEQIPSMGAEEEELLALGDVMREAGKGLFQIIASMKTELLDHELDFLRRFAARSGRTVTYSQAQASAEPDYIDRVLAKLGAMNAEPGVDVKAQLYPRPIGLIIGLRATVNPFCMAPSWAAIADLPLEAKVAEMRKPEVRARLISEAPLDPKNPVFLLSRNFAGTFELGRDVPNYEPAREQNIAARATAAGVTPAELVYDILLRDEGHALLMVAMSNYHHYNLDYAEAMLRNANVIVGLGDGGAHYGMVCDSSYPTFALTHWARDRDHGRFTIEEMVHILARKPAMAVGLRDRGLLAPGHRASVNLIDHDRLKLFPPEIVHDLPGGGKRLHQRAEGYVMTIVNGQIIAENGEPTGVHPGRLVRGVQSAQPANDIAATAVAAE